MELELNVELAQLLGSCSTTMDLTCLHMYTCGVTLVTYCLTLQARANTTPALLHCNTVIAIIIIQVQ